MINLIKFKLAALCVLTSSLAWAHANIGVFDLNQALFDTDAWQQRMEELDVELRDDQETAASLNRELRELQERINTNRATLTSAELRRLQEEGQVKQLRLQQIGERVQNILRANQNEFLQQYQDLVGSAIDQVYEEGAYDLILSAESIVKSGFTFDVTAKVTA
ncbi:MAG: OmpH family outer membrane protein, partial [Gammaproteobacteria bacterium]